MRHPDRLHRKPPFQTNFLDIIDLANPPKEPVLFGERTLGDVLTTDFPATILYFRQKFNLWPLTDETSIDRAVKWTKRLKELDAWESIDPDNTPVSVLIMAETLFFRNIFLNGRAMETYPNLKIAHRTGTRVWQEEIDAVIRITSDKFRIKPVKGPLNPRDFNHSTEVVKRLSLYFGGSTGNKEVDIVRVGDLLTKELLVAYWMFLSRKARIASSSAK